MSINIDVTFVISIRHKKKMFLALDKDEVNRLTFFRHTIVEYDDTAGLVELKKSIRNYIGEAIAPLLACKVGIKMHEFLHAARATVYIEVLFREQFKMKHLKLIPPEKVSKMVATPEVEMFLYQFYQEKKKVDIGSLVDEG